MTASEELLFERQGPIGLITFNRPQARNALTFAMYQRLADICRDPGDAKVLVVTGAGEKAFAAGTDIGQFRDFKTDQDALDYEAQIDVVLSAVEECPVPTVAAIAGACTGGGAAIAAACDLRLATADLKFGFPIARTLGNCLSVANLARLCALLGAGRVREILFTSRLVLAEEAMTAGLVSEVLADHAALMSRALALAEQLTEQAPLTLRATKEGLRRLARQDIEDEDLILCCYGSADFREGLEAFLAKRKPNWQGR
ncbi:enoyl-CoA hydratase [Pelagibius litoralis]|uniref:Enoyl-CoA hydratase n=1 Tax=Pelagibius litoralis TaxID=374515 RepID=A0A967F0E6_9PROT|nr:enoyl-CoA hydratase [Pelagibius litoralis]NIA70811.1 enoyl-CoA hydratase [Pelagibius litoralis]